MQLQFFFWHLLMAFFMAFLGTGKELIYWLMLFFVMLNQISIFIHLKRWLYFDLLRWYLLLFLYNWFFKTCGVVAWSRISFTWLQETWRRWNFPYFDWWPMITIPSCGIEKLVNEIGILGLLILVKIIWFIFKCLQILIWSCIILFIKNFLHIKLVIGCELHANRLTCPWANGLQIFNFLPFSLWFILANFLVNILNFNWPIKFVYLLMKI